MSYTPQQMKCWEQVLDILRRDMNSASYNMWFGKLKLHAVTQDALILIAEQSFIIDHIKSRYYTELFNCVHMTFGRDYELEFYTEEQLKNKLVNVRETSLVDKYTFENFVVGPSNSLACAAALAVAEQPSTVYNPLFIYGSVGLGKTHLLNAVGNFVLSQDPTKNVLLTTSESFTNELIDAFVKKTGLAELRSKMRNVDVLIVDDIQFLAKTKSTQEEFFHTFNDLHAQGKQIILSSDRPPRDIPMIEERLRSRFEWGLIVDIQKPDYETRVAILRKKAMEDNMNIPYNVIDFIAEHVNSNIRELEGALTRLDAECKLMGVPVTLETAATSLSHLVRAGGDRRVTADSITKVVCDQYGVSPDDMASSRRSRDIALPRQIAMYLCRELTSMSTTSIGQAFGGRDHTTVMHGCDKIAESVKNDIAFRNRIDDIIKIIREG